jgi:hypothetical protein
VRIFHRNFIFTKLPLKTVYDLLLHDLANLILKNIFYILLHLLQEQASWVCQCEDTVVQQLQEDFKQTLERQNSLEQWAIWLEGVVNKVLKPHEGTDNFPKAARQFLLKWSFYRLVFIKIPLLQVFLVKNRVR